MAAQNFGLDLGRSFIKVVQLKKVGTKEMLIAAASVPTPSGGIQSESPVDLKGVSAAVSECVKLAKVSGNKCIVSIVESQAVTRLIQMPNLTDKELSSAIHWEADQYIPLPLKDVNLQYSVASRPEPDSSGKMEVLLVAAPKRVIGKYLKIVKDAGLVLDAIETESAALSRALTKPGEPPSLIMSMGAFSTELVLVRDGNVIFTRSIASGGLSLTRAIASEFNLPESQAEKYKMAYGLSENKLSGKVAMVLRPILEVLVSEILKAVEFSHSHLGEDRLSRIINCGGGAFLPGLSAFLTERTSLEVSLADPWQYFVKEGLILKVAGQGTFYCVATGLSMRN